MQEVPFGKYVLVERIGAGGMAEVFRATTRGVGGFEKELAIKRILPQHSADTEFVNMFIDEANIAVSLNHANIAQIFDLGCINKSYFIAMEYVAGHNLAAILKLGAALGKPLPIELAVHVAMEVAKGLYAAHTAVDELGRPRGIIHRDISPQNIQIGFDGAVKIIDFGVAKAASKLVQTSAGTIRGKLIYMAPEQVRAQPIDARADLFALGLTLYKMLVGKNPFEAPAEMEVVSKLRRCHIDPPRALNDRIPVSLEAAIMKALARDPNQRHQNAHELYLELGRVLREISPDFSPLALGEYVRALFHDELEQRAARARDKHTAPERPAVVAGTAPELGRMSSSSTVAVPSSEPSQSSPGPLPSPPPAQPPPVAPPEPVPTAPGPPSAPADQQRVPTTPAEPLQHLSGPRQNAFGGLPPIPARRRRWPLIIGGLLVLTLAAGLGVFVGLRDVQDDSQGVDSRDTTPPDGTAPTRPRRKGSGARVDLKSTPSGANIILDGRRLTTTRPDGSEAPRQTPTLLQDIAPGRHRLRLVVVGYGSWEQEIDLPPGATINLKPHIREDRGVLRVRTTPRGAEVVVDGEPMGKTPIEVPNLPQGRAFRLELRLEGHPTFSDELTLGSEPKTVTHSFRRRRARRPRPATAAADEPKKPATPKGEPGKLSVGTVPWAAVYVDGKKIGHTPLRNYELPPGKHVVKLVHGADPSKTKTIPITIEPGKTRKVSHKFPL